MNNLSKLLITIITTLVLVVGVMIPITSGVEDNIKSTHQNVSERFMVKDNNLDLEITVEEIGVYKINGREHVGTSASIVIGEGLFIALSPTVYTLIDENNGIVKISNSLGTLISIDDGDYKYTQNGTTYTGTTETLLYPDERGSYGAFVNTDVRVDVDEEMYIISSQGAGRPKFVLESTNGVMNWNNAIFGPIVNTDSAITDYTQEITLNITQTNSEDGLTKTYSGLTFTSEEVTNNVMVYAPIKYHEIDANATAVKSIVNLLPLIVIIGLVGIAGYALMASMKTRSEL